MTDMLVSRELLERMVSSINHLHSQYGSGSEPIADVVKELRAALDAKPVEPGVGSVALWDGAAEWEQLAYHLCAEENGEESCNDLLWDSGVVPEPWGERWLKYEGEAKQMISLVRQFVPPVEPVAVPDWQPIETRPRDADATYLLANDKGQVAPCIRGVIHNNTGSTNWDWNYGEAATHWMPTPQPPASKENEE